MAKSLYSNTNVNNELIRYPITVGLTATTSNDGFVFSGENYGEIFRISQKGLGNAFVVEDKNNPNSTPLIIDSSGNLTVSTISGETSYTPGKPYSALTSDSLISKSLFEENDKNLGNSDLTLTTNRFLNFNTKQLTFDSIKSFRLLGSESQLTGDTLLYLESPYNTSDHPILKINNSSGGVLEIDSDSFVKIYGKSYLKNDNFFGTSLSNQHTFSGSVNIDGSLFINNESILTTSDSLIEFNVSGNTDGVNDTFYLSPEPSQQYPFLVFKNGKLLNNSGYSLSGVVLTFITPPISGSTLQIYGLVATGKDRYKNVSVTMQNDGGEIASGIKGIINIPFNGQIIGWSILTDSIGDIVIDIYKDSFDNFVYPGSQINSITNGNKPTLNNQIKKKSFNVGSWNTSLNKYDVLTVNVDSTNNLSYVNFNIYMKDIS
jgi:hypothetical protein